MKCVLRSVTFLALLSAFTGTSCWHGSNKPEQSSDGSTGTSANNPQEARQPAGGEVPGLRGQAASEPHNYQLTIPDGTPIDVRLTNSIGSARSVQGQSFAATLDRPIVVDGSVLVPQGARVTGRVLMARPSGHLRTPAGLAVTLTSLEIDGQSHDIVTSRRSWRGKSHKGHNAKWIAGASGFGALLGALIGHGEGAAIGAGLGAGGGVATAYATGKKDILLPSEMELHFVLRQPVTVTES